ncbi:MAG: hypothetical protein ACK559_15635, partial [bacterium]
TGQVAVGHHLHPVGAGGEIPHGGGVIAEARLNDQLHTTREGVRATGAGQAGGRIAGGEEELQRCGFQLQGHQQVSGGQVQPISSQVRLLAQLHLRRVHPGNADRGRGAADGVGMISVEERLGIQAHGGTQGAIGDQIPHHVALQQPAAAAQHLRHPAEGVQIIVDDALASDGDALAVGGEVPSCLALRHCGRGVLATFEDLLRHDLPSHLIVRNGLKVRQVPLPCEGCPGLGLLGIGTEESLAGDALEQQREVAGAVERPFHHRILRHALGVHPTALQVTAAHLQSRQAQGWLADLARGLQQASPALQLGLVRAHHRLALVPDHGKSRAGRVASMHRCRGLDRNPMAAHHLDHALFDALAAGGFQHLSHLSGIHAGQLARLTHPGLSLELQGLGTQLLQLAAGVVQRNSGRRHRTLNSRGLDRNRRGHSHRALPGLGQFIHGERISF